MIGPRPNCMDCTHRDENNFDGITCKAFPEGIPDDILVKGKKHTAKRPDQTGDFIFKRKS